MALFAGFSAWYREFIKPRGEQTMTEKESRFICAFRELDNEAKDAVEHFLRWLLSDPKAYLAFHQRAIESNQSNASRGS